ncbi:MAG: diguanylate cyclase, partial [bacterium]
FMDPPLTTVRQDCEAQGRKASELALRMLRGEEVRSVYLPARLQVRCSCGCQGVEQGNRNAFLMGERTSKKRMVHENLISALLLRNLLQEDVTVHSFFYSLGKVLSTIGARSSRIALLKEPMDVHGKGRLFLPEELRVHLVQEGEELTSFSREMAPLVTMGGFSPLLTIPSGGRYATAVFPLFYGNMHYGVLLVQTERNDILFDFMLSLEIGTGLRYLYLALAQQVSQAALEAQNDVLNYSANHDALTGLLNRAGITRAIAAYLQGARREERYVVVMADLDHLKQINDTFGHSAGDLAIRTAAELLQGALPVGSPLGRTGGDEFSAVFAVSERYDAACFQTRLAELTRIWNLEHSIPFLVRVSAGVHTFSFSDTNDLAQVIKFADADLYRAKKSRPDSVILA